MQKMGLFLNKNAGKLLWISILLYIVIFAAICLFKYSQFGYNGLDVAIYNQVFFKSVHGQLFGFTIHPQSYLGDHFELFIILLLPFYYLFQSPITLLLLQTIALAICAWPLFLIAKKFLSSQWSLAVAFLWLVNPFVQNINLFEFHILPFALFFLFFAVYYYLEKKFRPFLIFIGLSLIVREDVALVVVMFGLLALIEKRSLKWIIWPIVLGSIWFCLAIKVINHFTPTGTYKFTHYYDWLGQTVPQMAFNFFFKPLNTLKHIFSVNNFLFVSLMFIPLGFIHLIKPKYLILALPAFSQILLGGEDTSLITLKLHYTTLFLPGIFLALIFSLQKIQQQNPAKNFLNKYRTLLIIILFTGGIYGMLTLGPIPTAAKKLLARNHGKEIIALKKQLAEKINNEIPVIAGYDLLTAVSGRNKVYALHYAFVGKKQFSDLDYETPADTEAMIMDFEDLLTFNIQFPNNRYWAKQYQQGDDNLRKILKDNNLGAEELIDSLAYFKKGSKNDLELYRLLDAQENYITKNTVKFNNGIEFLGWEKINQPIKNKDHYLLPAALYFKTNQKLTEDFRLTFILKNEAGEIIHEKTYPLGYGLYPATEWQPEQIIKFNHYFLIPQNIADQAYRPFIELSSIKGFLTLDGWGSATIHIGEENKLTPQIPLF